MFDLNEPLFYIPPIKLDDGVVMGKLDKDITLANSMKKLLLAMQLDFTGVEITSAQGLFNFSFAVGTNCNSFIKRLNEVVQDGPVINPVQVMDLSEIIDTELENATCSDAVLTEILKLACKGVLEVVKNMPLHYSSESGEIEIKLPFPECARLLNLLHYPNMRFSEDGNLFINIKKILENTMGVVKVTRFNSVLVFLNSDSLKMIYAKESLPDGKVKVIPHLFVPRLQEDIFKSTVVVRHKAGGSAESNYSLPVERSGQLISLNEVICNPGDVIDIIVVDGAGDNIIDCRKQIDAPSKPIANASIMQSIGINRTATSAQARAIPRNDLTETSSPNQ